MLVEANTLANSSQQIKPDGEASFAELLELATRINNEHAEAVAGMRKTIVHAIAAGNLLDEVKRHVGHGAFLPWIEKNCVFKKSTAELYLRLARRTNALPGIEQKIAGMGLNEADGYLRRKRWGGRLNQKTIERELGDRLFAIRELLERIRRRVGDEAWDSRVVSLTVTNAEREKIEIDIQALIYFDGWPLRLPFDLIDYPDEEGEEEYIDDDFSWADEESSGDETPEKISNEHSGEEEEEANSCDNTTGEIYNPLEICNEQTPAEDEEEEAAS